MSAIVTIDNVVKEYNLGATVVQALRGVSLTVDKGEFISIAGPSGSGKTTLLNLIGCVDTATRGKVEVAGKNTALLSERAERQRSEQRHGVRRSNAIGQRHAVKRRHAV